MATDSWAPCWRNRPSPDAFTEAAASRLEVLARQAGIALSNPRLMERPRRSETQLRESESRSRHLVTASPDVVWEVDREGRLPFVSDVVERLTGYRPEGIVGRHMSELISPETIGHAQRQLQDIMAHPDRVAVGRFALLRRDGTSVPIENFATGMVRDGVLEGGHGAPGPCPSATGWSVTSAARPRSSPRAPSGPTSPARSTIRSPRRCSR